MPSTVTLQDIPKTAAWRKSRHTNLRIYLPTGEFHVFAKVGGRIVRGSCHTTVQAVALSKRDELLGAARKQSEVRGSIGAERLTVGAYTDTFKANLTSRTDLKPRSKAHVLECLQILERTWPALQHSQVRKVTEFQCIEWADRVRPQYSAPRFNGVLSALRQVFQIAVDRGARLDNPTTKIKRSRIKITAPQLPEPAEFEALVGRIRAGGARQSRDCADLVEFLAYTGLRIAEAGSLQKRDVRLDRDEILLSGDMTKNGQTRTVPIIPQCRPLVEKWMARVGADDQLCPIKGCYGALRSASKASGLTGFSHHTLRHLFATRCLECGVDVRTVAAWLGHQDGGALLLRRYAHLRPHHEKIQARRVYFSPKEQPAIATR